MLTGIEQNSGANSSLHRVRCWHRSRANKEIPGTLDHPLFPWRGWGRRRGIGEWREHFFVRVDKLFPPSGMGEPSKKSFRDAPGELACFREVGEDGDGSDSHLANLKRES